jgi:biopolymer transport protein ExbB
MGMVKAFQIIQEKATSLHLVSPGDLAGGIWEALITTAAGLIVAIPTFVAYNYLVSRVKGFILEMERATTDLINILAQRGEQY